MPLPDRLALRISRVSLLTLNVDSFAEQHAPHLPHPVDAVIVSVNLAEMLYKGGVVKATST